MSHDASRGSAGRRGRAALAVVGLLAALLFVVVYRQVLGITQRPSWPPPAGAVTAASAQAATEAFDAEGGKRPHDAALDLAWSTAATIDPWVEGANFFPRIFADVEAARSSVHILLFGWRQGEVASKLAELLEKNPVRAVEKAIRGMLPKNSLGRAQLKKLKVYAGPEHPHSAQQPKPYTLTQVAQ